jgi:tetratricopeptide (TPR) repeat protein
MILSPRALAALLLTAPLFAAACNSGPDQMDPEQRLAMHREFALRYYDEGDLDRAEGQVDKGLEVEPKDEKLRLMKGWIRQRRGSVEDIFIAEKIFRTLVRGKDYRALLGLGEALERKGVLYWESAAAVESGERFTEAADPIARAAELRGNAGKSWAESIDFYERTLKQKPGEIQALNGLQRVHALSGDPAGSLSWSRQLIDQSTAEIAFWRTQLERADLTAAEETRLRELLASSSDLLIQTHVHASTVLVQLDRSEEALAHIDTSIELDPTDSNTHSRRAQLLYALGRTEEAVASMQDFLRLSELDFEHPDVVRAIQLLTTWQRELEFAGR